MESVNATIEYHWYCPECDRSFIRPVSTGGSGLSRVTCDDCCTTYEVEFGIDTTRGGQLSAVVRKYRKWREGKDDGWIYDEIFNFVDGELSRGEVLRMLDFVDSLVEPGPCEPRSSWDGTSCKHDCVQ